MFTLFRILNERNITFEEFFNNCDIDNSGHIDIEEIDVVLQSYSAEFYHKEIVAIMNYFNINKNSQCSKSNFFRQINRAERLLDQHERRLEERKVDTESSMNIKVFDSSEKFVATTGNYGTLDTLNDRDDTEAMSEFIPRWQSMTKNQQAEQVSQYLIEQFKAKNNLNPIRVYAMADRFREGKIKFSAISEVL